MSRHESPRQHFDNVEHQLNKDLANGHEIKAASLLLDEFDKNPEEARALVKRAMALPNSDTLLHLNIDKNGDIFVWDPTEHNGIYAGHAEDLIPKQDCPPAAPPVADVPPPAAPQPPTSDVPPPPTTAAGAGTNPPPRSSGTGGLRGRPQIPGIEPRLGPFGSIRPQVFRSWSQCWNR